MNASIYDPQVEFLEIGVADGAPPRWFLPNAPFEGKRGIRGGNGQRG
jgi:hypothetical protein